MYIRFLFACEEMIYPCAVFVKRRKFFLVCGRISLLKEVPMRTKATSYFPVSGIATGLRGTTTSPYSTS